MTFLILAMAFNHAEAYDFLAFSSTWLPSKCQTLSCNFTEYPSDTSFFNIHGMWPDNLSGDNPGFCNNNSAFNQSSLSSRNQDLMGDFWISYSGSNQDFHDHEWSKHGTCWEDPSNSVDDIEKQNAYFKMIMEYAIDLDIYGMLASGGIYPQITPISLSDIEDAFAAASLKGSYMLECSQDAQGNTYFTDVTFCITNDLSEFLVCPDSTIALLPDICKEEMIYYAPQSQQAILEVIM